MNSDALGLCGYLLNLKFICHIYTTLGVQDVILSKNTKGFQVNATTTKTETEIG